MLISTNPNKHNRIMRAANNRFPRQSKSLYFEHGQWWLTLNNTGAQYSVVDAEGPGIRYGIDFEQVSEGIDDY